MVDLNEANFEGLHVQVRCPPGPFVEAGDAQKACRKIQQLFVNQGAVIDPHFKTIDIGIVVKTDRISGKYLQRYSAPFEKIHSRERLRA